MDKLSGKNVLAKITSDKEMNFKEHSILMALQGQSHFPVLYGGGTFNAQGADSKSFLIMEQLGKNLDQILEERQKCFTLHTICQLGIHLVSSLEKLHAIGCVHNDIKPENIVIDSQNMLYPVKLIDFGLCSTFLEADGSHIKP
jgi:serine/threonine protein kinase